MEESTEISCDELYDVGGLRLAIRLSRGRTSSSAAMLTDYLEYLVHDGVVMRILLSSIFDDELRRCAKAEDLPLSYSQTRQTVADRHFHLYSRRKKQ
jgi:hypothetical protein